MQCVKYDKQNQRASYTKASIPTVEHNEEVVVKVMLAGVCGTDVHIIHGKFDAVDGVILGHEIVGVVYQVPDGCTSLIVGDRVVLNPNISCSRCINCKKGLYNFCNSGGLQYTLGIGTDGGWAQYCKAHVSLVYKISDNISFEQAVLCEPLSCVVHALDKLPSIDIGSNILDIGAGIIGLLWSTVLHVMGHRRVFVSEPNEGRKKTMDDLELGYKCMEWNKILHYQEHDPEWKIDLCIDCSGNANAIQAAFPLLEYGSTLLIFGVADPSKTISVSPYELYKKEITLMGTAINTITSFHKAVALLESLANRYIDMDKMAMKKFKLSEFEKALDTFTKGTYSKIIFELSP